jgi:hypothetical protein
MSRKGRGTVIWLGRQSCTALLAVDQARTSPPLLL